jgi:hypothetical protein
VTLAERAVETAQLAGADRRALVTARNKVDVEADRRREPFGPLRTRPGDRRLRALQELLDALFEHVEQQLFFGAAVEVQRGDGDARVSSDVAHRGSVAAMHREVVARSVTNQIDAGDACVSVSGSAISRW